MFWYPFCKFVLLLVFCSSVHGNDCEQKIEFAPSEDTYPFGAPQLPYPNTQLAPQLTSQMVYLHHQYHHAKYVDKLNLYVSDHEDYQDNTLVELVDLARDDTSLQKYAGGHYNHLLYWWVMNNEHCTESEPSGELFDLIEETWGSFDDFQDEFLEEAASVVGSGWVWLCVNEDEDLEIRTTENEINPLMEVGSDICYPCLGVNLWQHAYYLKYIWNRPQYVTEFWKLIDWEVVTYFYDEYASQLEGIPL